MCHVHVPSSQHTHTAHIQHQHMRCNILAQTHECMCACPYLPAQSLHICFDHVFVLIWQWSLLKCNNRSVHDWSLPAWTSSNTEAWHGSTISVTTTYLLHTPTHLSRVHVVIHVTSCYAACWTGPVLQLVGAGTMVRHNTSDMSVMHTTRYSHCCCCLLQQFQAIHTFFS